MSKSREKFVWITALIVIIVFPVLFYFSRFSGPLSNETKVWADFATYLGVFVSSANLLALIYFSIRVYNYNIAIDRPVLHFELDRKDNCYYAINVGRGAAINMRCKSNYDQTTGWESHVIFYALAPLEKRLIETKNTNALLAHYTDINGVSYSSLMVNDTNYIYTSDIKPPAEHQHYFSAKAPSSTWPPSGFSVA